MSARVTDGHHSGWAPSSVDDWLDVLEEMRREGCETFSVTEANGENARVAIHTFCRRRKWGAVHFHGAAGVGECAILYDLSVFRADKSEVILLTDLTLKTARKAPIYAVLTRLTHLETGAVDWPTVAHLPAHLEGKRGFLPGWPSKVHREAVKGWRRALKVRHILRKATIKGDFNLNLRLLWVRAWLKAQFPTMRSAWRRPFPRLGTFKRRIIDWAITRHKVVVKARLVDDQDPVDHVGFVFTKLLR